MVWCRVVKSSVTTGWSLALFTLVSALSAVSPISAATFQIERDEIKPDGPVVVYLVRHAEKAEDGTDDPPLALAGQIRVQVLRQLLADANLTHVYTTDLKRTRDTARPFAEALGTEATIYDPRRLDVLAETIRATPGTHLVSGHSNTTPVLVEALGGDPFGAIDELEYDRLYIVVIHPDQPPVTTLLRFGEPYVEGTDFGLRADRGLPGPSASRRHN